MVAVTTKIWNLEAILDSGGVLYTLYIHLDVDYLRGVVKDVIRKRRAQKNQDHIFLDSLMDAEFIDEEEVGHRNRF